MRETDKFRSIRYKYSRLGRERAMLKLDDVNRITPNVSELVDRLFFQDEDSSGVKKNDGRLNPSIVSQLFVA